MAPRKTTKTAADTAAEQADLVKQAEAAAEQDPNRVVTLNIQNLAEDTFNLELRFQVALAVLPAMYPYVGSDECLADENEAGACARIAFEYADAFIAQSKKGQGDAG